MESLHGVWTVGEFAESSQGFCVCLYAVNMPVLCIAACKNSDLIRTGCHTNAPICTFCHVRHVVSRKKYTTAPPRELSISIEIGIYEHLIPACNTGSQMARLSQVAWSENGFSYTY